ncbi:IS3 family transposase [Streptomyces sp. NBC_01224]|uniref:IS3 family transposase n=1 Tax=Streptomyces sp. NBC_01224 TaxID=2903783 RepID=UPI002E15F6BA|nr:IS3 family transposase [Streptomyces sp. NBC_01224]
MGSKYTKRYSEEYKRHAVELVRSSGRTVTEVARELGVSSESLRGRVKKARAAQDTGPAPGPARATDDRDEELKRLRKLTAEQAKTIEILKKGDSLLREGERPVSTACRFIHAEKANYTVTLLCKVMKTARSTSYAWVAGREARETRQWEDEALAHEITVIHLASRRNYGVPRVTAEPRRRGRLVNRKRVERVMREHGIAGNSRRIRRRGLTKRS